MTGRHMFLVVVVLFALPDRDNVFAVDEPGRIEPQPLCGANCLYVALKSLDVDVGGFDELLTQLPGVTLSGYSFGELAVAAETYGVETLAVETSLTNLERRNGRFACIAHLDSNHFVLVNDVDTSNVTLIDPPLQKTIGRSVFAQLWDGRALLISASPLVPEEHLAQRPDWILIGTAGLVVCAAVFLFLKRIR